MGSGEVFEAGHTVTIMQTWGNKDDNCMLRMRQNDRRAGNPDSIQSYSTSF